LPEALLEPPSPRPLPSAVRAAHAWAPAPVGEEDSLCWVRAPAPTPGRAAKLTRTQIVSALKRAGPKRGIEAEAERIHEVFRGDVAHQLPLLEDALGQQMLALLGQLEVACVATDDLARAVEEVFPRHPEADVILSFPGLGTQLGARVPRSGTTAHGSRTVAA